MIEPVGIHYRPLPPLPWPEAPLLGRLVDLGGDGDLDGGIQRHVGDPDGQPSMGSAGTENRVEQIGGPIEHLRMPTESRGAVNIAFHAHQTTDPINIATSSRLELGQGVERALSGRLIPLLHREFGTEPACVSHHAVAPGQLPRSEHQIAGAHPRLIGGDRSRSRRHHDSQTFQVLGDVHVACDSVRRAIAAQTAAEPVRAAALETAEKLRHFACGPSAP